MPDAVRLTDDPDITYFLAGLPQFILYVHVGNPPLKVYVAPLPLVQRIRPMRPARQAVTRSSGSHPYPDFY